MNPTGIDGGTKSVISPGFVPGFAATYREAAPSPADQPKSRVLACVDDGRVAPLVIKHALAVAAALGLPVTVARVMEAMSHVSGPADPLEWHLRMSESREQLREIVEREHMAGADCVLLAGATAADELNAWASVNNGALLALATHSHHAEGQTGLGATVHKVLDHASASLLLVPNTADKAGAVTYRTLLVPLDGSSRAESVLPTAVRIARAHGAELILTHVLPKVEIVEANPREEAARDLYARLTRHNEDRGRNYLEGLRVQLSKEGAVVRTVIAVNGDPREQLRRIAIEHHVDLVVLSSHGRSGLSDVACGSVTEYLVSHAPAPLLIIRPDFLFGADQPGSHAPEPAASRVGSAAH